jgi:hypothetical protein
LVLHRSVLFPEVQRPYHWGAMMAFCQQL